MFDLHKKTALASKLQKMPWVSLGHFPTPLDALPRILSDASGNNLFLKRDDCSGLGLGGNKVRQLEYYLGDALAKGCDTVLSTGAVQSNYMRTLAAASAKLGLECHVQLESRVSTEDPDYLLSGNVLLNKMFGANLYSYAKGEDESGADAELAKIAEGLEQKGRKPYIVPLAPVEQPKGAMGYVAAAIELAEQCQQSELRPDLIVVPSGSSLTHAGLLTGCRAMGWQVPVLGACVRRQAELQRPRVVDTCEKLEAMLELGKVVQADDVWVNDIALAPGYGQASQAVLDAISLMSKKEGILVDPVYSGKTLSCTLQLLENEALTKFRNIVMIHTGGTPAIFAYRAQLTAI